MKLREILACDFEERYGAPPQNLKAVICAAVRCRDFAAVCIYRLHVSLVKHRRVIPGLRTLVYHILTSYFQIDIRPNARIGPGLVLHHAMMIVIGEGVTIGRRFHIYHVVTIGSKNQFALDCYPTLGNDVTIYTGSVVAGKIQIGDDVIIGANSLVLHDVPSHSVVYSETASSKVNRKSHAKSRG